MKVIKFYLVKRSKKQCKKQQLNNNKCLIVINKKDIFVGTLSDGDIRNAILSKKLTNKIDKFVNRDPCYFYENKYQISELKKNSN